MASFLPIKNITFNKIHFQFEVEFEIRKVGKMKCNTAYLMKSLYLIKVSY